MRQLKITKSITRRDAKSLDKYLAEISKFHVLTPEQEVECFIRFRNGDQSALSEIIKCNLRFVVSVAKQYQHTGLTLSDLINEGNLGLIKAARRFDVTRGFKFISYAVWWIRQSILQAINEKGRKIRLPLNHQSNATKIKRSEISFLQKHERMPEINELADATGMNMKKIKNCLESYPKCHSLDAPVNADGDVALSNLFEDQKIPQPDFELAVDESRKQEVAFLLNTLTPREATIISLFFGIQRKLPMTLNDIGDHIGITRERVRQIKDRSIKKLRRSQRQMQAV